MWKGSLLGDSLVSLLVMFLGEAHILQEFGINALQ